MTQLAGFLSLSAILFAFLTSCGDPAPPQGDVSHRTSFILQSK